MPYDGFDNPADDDPTDNPEDGGTIDDLIEPLSTPPADPDGDPVEIDVRTSALREVARERLDRLARARTQSLDYLGSTQESALKHSFLDAFRSQPVISKACSAIGIRPGKFYRWVDSDAVFAQDFIDTRDETVDELVIAARTRAVDGVTVPVGWYQGVPGGTVQQYSDTLLMFLLKGFRPETFDRSSVGRQHPIDNPGNTPAGSTMGSSQIPIERLPLEGQLELIEVLMKYLGGDTNIPMPGGQVMKLKDVVGMMKANLPAQAQSAQAQPAIAVTPIPTPAPTEDPQCHTSTKSYRW